MGLIKNIIKKNLNKHYGYQAIIEKNNIEPKNLCIISNDNIKNIKIKCEDSLYKIQCSNFEDIQTMDYSKKIYGFLNILSFKNNCVLKFDDIYKVCQNQANYYINNKISGKIVNIVRISNINTLETYYLKCMTEGLAKALGNHSVIVNGLLIDENIDAEIESAWAVYLLSIFGAAISGQVVTLSSTQKNLEYNFPQTF